jgi:RimJ/RimL family protein N-acetyltransferase
VIAQWEFPSKNLILENRWVRVDSIDLASDLEALFSAASIDSNGEDIFKYHVNVAPMHNVQTYREYLRKKLDLATEVTYKIFSKRLNRLVGCASLMNINKDHGTVEVGSIWYTKEAQKTEINSNAMFLIFSYVFEDLKYRRLEWKCNNLNEDSKRAAVRLGFEYEGLFRQHYLSRGQNRDTAWFSIIDAEWAEKKEKLEARLRKTRSIP